MSFLCRTARRAGLFEPEHNLGRIPGDDAVRRHVSSNDRAGRNDAAFSDLYAWKNDAPQANPHAVLNHNWPDFFRIGGVAGPPEPRVAGMAVGIHQDNSPGEIAV